MMDVGQGDAIALRTSHGHWILFDAGRAWRGGDAGRSTVVPYIGRRGGQLDAFVLSHPHTDHVGGAASVLRTLHPATYVDAGFAGGADAYRASLDVARDDGSQLGARPPRRLARDRRRERPRSSRRIRRGPRRSPIRISRAWSRSFASATCACCSSATRSAPEEEWLLARDSAMLHADILKVGHHGSGTSSSERFLTAVRPRLALVSVGAGNTYHLPTPSVMRALAAHGAQVLRTDHLGAIVARTDGRRIIVEAAGDTWELSRDLPTLSPPPSGR